LEKPSPRSASWLRVEQATLDSGFEEIGDIFRVTRERIRQVQNLALRKLRGALRRRERSLVDLN